MTLEEYRTILLKGAMAAGCTAAEVYCAESESVAVGVQNGEIEKYTVSADRGLSLRVVVDGQDGFAGTEVFENAEELIRRAIDNARTVDSVDDHPMQGKSEYKLQSMPEQKMCSMTERELIELAQDIEKRTLASDSRVKRTMMCQVAVQKNTTSMANTMGLEASHTMELSDAVVGVVMEQAGEERNAYAIRIGGATNDIDGMIQEAVQDCVRGFGAKPIPAGEYRVLLSNKSFSAMLEVFSGVFSAYAAQKGLSLLAGKEGEQVASPCITLCDDPENAMLPTPFDGEGVPTRYKEIIRDGKLVTLLHSLKTAKVAGVESTGNGTRTGGCQATNFYIKPSDKSFDELVQGERILVVNELNVGGAGVNEVSGEFSISVVGELYENGKRVGAVNQITIAGNFYELMKNIIAVGNDLVLNAPMYSDASGLVGAPCALIDKLVVAG